MTDASGNDDDRWWQGLREVVRADSLFWRRILTNGVRGGPEAFVRYSPPVFGWAFAAALGQQRSRALRMLRKVHGKRSALVETRDIAEVFANFASSMTDALLVGSDRGYFPTSRPVGDWNLLSSMARGEGVVLATAQTAGWDVGGSIVCGKHRQDVMVVMEREPDARARKVHDQVRQRSGIKLVHVGNDPLAALPLLRHLRGGGVVAMKIDRAAAGMRARRVSFFGEPWSIPEGPLTLAALSGAPIVLVLTRRLGFLDYEPTNHEPIYLPRRPTEQQLDHAAQTLADHLETFVRRHPTHYFQFTE